MEDLLLSRNWDQYKVNTSNDEPESKRDWDQYRVPEQKSNLLDTFKNAVGKIAPSMPPGVNMATGMMSMAFPGKQADMVANLPQVMRGTQPTASESAAQTVGEFLPGLEVGGPPVTKFGKGVWNVLNQKNPKELAYGIQKAHDVLKSQASDIYNFVKSEVKPRGVGKINISEDVINEAERHLPRDRASKLLIEKARNGDYEALHQLQSDLGKEGTRNLGAESYADRNLGKEMLDTRDKINSSISDQFKEYGHEDLSKMLDMAKGKWAKLKDIYYSHPTIAKLVHEDSRKMPRKPLNVFSEESVPMKKITQEHPEITEALEKNKLAEKFMNKLKTTGKLGLIGAGGVGAPIYGAYKLLELLKGNE